VVEEYGVEAFEWSPETIALELHDDFQIALPKVNHDKIMAGIAVITTDQFWADLPSFIQLCNVLADDEFQPEEFDPADAHEMAWAITEAVLLDEPEDLKNLFSDDIRRYIGAVIVEEGLVNPPDILALAIQDTPLEDPLHLSASDPEMYAAFWDNQNSKSQEIKDMIRRQTMELFQQLEELPLRNGNTDNLIKKLRDSMNSTNSGGNG